MHLFLIGFYLVLAVDVGNKSAIYAIHSDDSTNKRVAIHVGNLTANATFTLRHVLFGKSNGVAFDIIW